MLLLLLFLKNNIKIYLQTEYVVQLADLVIIIYIRHG